MIIKYGVISLLVALSLMAAVAASGPALADFNPENDSAQGSSQNVSVNATASAFFVENATVGSYALITLPFINLTGLELVILKGDVSFRFVDASAFMAFNPREAGAYTAIISSLSGQVANASFNVSEPLPRLVSEKAVYEVGETIILELNPRAEARLSFVFNNTRYQLAGHDNYTFRFKPPQAGNYTFMAASENWTASLDVAVIAAHAAAGFSKTGDEASVASFYLDDDAAFQVNLTLLVESRKSIIDRLVGTSPITQLTAFVEGHENDSRFRLSILPIARDVFVAKVHSNPEIGQGNYTLVVKVTLNGEEASKKSRFEWVHRLNYTLPSGRTPASGSLSSDEPLPLNYSFSLSEDAELDVMFTKPLSSLRSFLDNALGRSIMDTLSVYVDGYESNESYKPEVSRIRADDFSVRIKSSPEIKPGLYELVVVGTTSKAIIRQNIMFSWGLSSSEIKDELLELENAKSSVQETLGVYANVSQRLAVQGIGGEPIAYRLTAIDANITEMQMDSLGMKITFFNFSEEGKLTVWASLDSGNPPGFETTQPYGLDPSLLFYESAFLTKSFSGNAVSACSYDFSSRMCVSEPEPLAVINGSYSAALDSPKAFFESYAVVVTALGLKESSESPKVSFYREMPDVLFEGVPAKVRFVVLSDRKLENLTVIDDLPSGWESGSRLNSTHSLVSFSVSEIAVGVSSSASAKRKPAISEHAQNTPRALARGGFDMSGNVSVAEYSITPLAKADGIFSSRLQYAFGNRSIAISAENDPYAAKAFNKTSFSTDVSFSVNGNPFSRELATGITYDAEFRLESFGPDVKHETVFLWPFNDSLISVGRVNGDCGKSALVYFAGTMNLECVFESFPANSVKRFNVEVTAKNPGAHFSRVNVTYDPPARIVVTKIRKAPYAVSMKPELKGEDLLIAISNPDSSYQPIQIRGDVKYLLSRPGVGGNDTAFVLVEGYGNEYFTIAVGDELQAFGEYPLEVVGRDGKRRSFTEKIMALPYAFSVWAASGIKSFMISSIRFVRQVPFAITGMLVASDGSSQASAAGVPNVTLEVLPVHEGLPQKKDAEPAVQKDGAAQPAKKDELPKPQPEPQAREDDEPKIIIERSSPGTGDERRQPSPPVNEPGDAPAGQNKKIIEQKEFVTVLQPLTFSAIDAAPPFELTSKISRSVSCSRCDDFSVPADSEVLITLSARNFRKIPNATLTEFYPADWSLIDGRGGAAGVYNSTHSTISWQVPEASLSMERAYSLKSPTQARDSYGFHSELSSGNASISEGLHKIFVEPFDVVVETPSKRRFSSDVKIVRVVKEERDNVTVDLELKFSTTRISGITLSNVTFGKKSAFSIGFDEIPEAKAEFSGKNFVKAYAIDPSSLVFDSGTISAVAKGTRLMKCEGWNFNSRSCSSGWKHVLNITPGQPYTIAINSSDPAWAEEGLVAINTHKSIYLPGDLAKIGIGVLDSKGNVVCNASVTLAVTAPSGARSTYSTGDGSIAVSPQCFVLGVTDEPDYSANYTVSELGIHEMNLTVITYDGEPFMISSFTVQDSVSFDVERVGPTRIFPFVPYSFNFTILANESFEGNVTEVVPEGFVISGTTAMVIDGGNEKLIVWNATLLAGAPYSFAYSFDAPDVSPLRYELGPLRIGSFSEARQWQIASDAGPGAWTDSGLACSPQSVSNGSAVNCTVTYTCTGNDCTRGSAGFHLRDDSVNIDDASCADTDFKCSGVAVTGTCTDLASSQATCRGGYGATGCPVGQTIVVDYRFTACSGVEAPTSTSAITPIFVDDGGGADTATLDESLSLYVLETVLPNVSITLPPQNFNLSGTFVVNASANDSQSSLSSVNLSLLRPGLVAAGPVPMNLSVGSLLSGYFNTTFDSTSVADGFYNLSVNATDSARNTRISQNVSVTIDNTKPSVAIVSPSNASNFSSGFLINASVNDSTSLVFNVSFRIYNSSGNATLWLYSTRNSGNSAAGYWNSTVETAGMPDGLYNITVNATDFAGNQLVQNFSQIRVDTSASANISMVSPLNGSVVSDEITINASVNDTQSLTMSVAFRLANQSVSSTWSAASLTSGTVEQGYWISDFNTVTLGDGTYNVTINATDFAGNSQLINVSWVDIDNIPDLTAPNATIIFPRGNANVSSLILVNASVNDTGGVVAWAGILVYNNTGNATAYLSMSLGAGSSVTGYWNLTLDTALLWEGFYNLSVNATDAAGNSNVSAANVSILVDNTKPNATAMAPDNGSVFSEEQFAITAAVNDSLSGVSNVSFSLSSAASGMRTQWIYAPLASGSSFDGEWSITFDSAQVSSGDYNITINATDYSGNQQLINISQVTVSNMLPNVSIVSPSGGNFSGSFLVNASVNSTSQVTDVNLSLMQPGGLSAGPVPMQLTSGTAYSGYRTVTFNSLSVGDGMHNLSVNASYGSGNYRISGNVTILVDNSPPNVTIDAPANGSIVSEVLTINASINDSASDVINVSFRLISPDGGTTAWLNSTLGQGTARAGYWNATIDTWLLRNAVYKITVNATDSMSNNLVTNISSITVDNRNRAAGENENRILMAQACRLEADVSCGASASNCETFSSACAGTYPASCPSDRLSCNDVTNESSATSNNNWVGVNITSFNSTMTDCQAITSVMACFEWYQSGTSKSFFNCNLGVDRGGDLSWTRTPISCPTTTQDILTCVDVTSQEGGWQCSSFFGISQPSAWAYVEAKRTEAGGGSNSLHIDALYFNVTFDVDSLPPNISIILPAGKANISGSFLVNVSINETTSVLAANITLYNSTHNVTGALPLTNGSGNSSIGYWNLTFDGTTLPDGFYNISVNAADSTGHAGTSANTSVAIDNTPSNATIVIPSNGTIFSGSTILMNASVNDSTSGVANVSFRIANSWGTVVTELLYAARSSGNLGQGYWSASRTSSTLPNGRYNITLNVTDFAGNKFAINASTFEVEIAAPNVSVVRPAELSNVSSSLFVNVSINTTGVVSRANVSLHNSTGNVTAFIPMSLGAGTSSAGFWNATISVSSLADGFYNVSVNATDAGGNLNVSRNVSIVVDNTPPNITAIAPSNGSSFQNQDILINASVNDSLTKVFNVTYRMSRSDGSTVTGWLYAQLGSGTIASGYWNATLASTAVPNGYYNITANVTDFAGAWRLVNISQVVIDNILPNVSIVVPAQQYLNISGTFLINASVNSSTNNVNDVNLSLFRPGSTASGPLPMSLASGTAMSGYRTLSFNSATVADGFYNLSVNATDAVRNTQISGNVSVIIDNTKPNATAISPLNDSNNLGVFLINASVNDSLTKVFNVSFRITNSDGSSVTQWLYAQLGSGAISSGYWNASFDMSSLRQARYNITINATDFAGNQRITNISAFFFDSVVPNNSIKSPVQFANLSGSVSVDVSINDTASGTAGANLTVYNSTGNATGLLPMSLSSGNIMAGLWRYTLDTTTLVDGHYNLSVNATDFSGNVNLSRNVSVVIDNTQPNASAVSPLNGTVFEESLVLINASLNDSLSMVFNASFRITSSDGSVVTPWFGAFLNSGNAASGYWNASYGSASLVNGLYNITVNATDFSGNSRLVNISQIEVFNVPPNTTIIFPLSGANISGSMLVNASINDSGSVAWVNLTIFNSTGNVTAFIPMSLGAGTPSAGFWSVTVNTGTAIPRDGAYNLSVNATDSARNINISSNVSVNIDNTLPNSTMIFPLNFSNNFGLLVINASVNDSTTGIFNVTFRLTTAHGQKTEWLYASMGQGSIHQGYWNATIDMASIPQARYNITINATDFAGNQLIANVSQIFSDSMAPNTTIVLPVQFANLSGSFVVNASINDSSALVEKVNFTIFNNTGNATGFIMMTLGAGTTTAGYWNATFNSAALPDGFYNLSVNATDYTGNTNITLNTSITVDNTPANITSVLPANNTIFEEISILINASVNDTPSRVRNVTFRLVRSDGVVASSLLQASLSSGNIDQGYWNASTSSTALNNGLYNITANVTDFSGNSRLVNISQIEISNIAPNTTIIIPLSGANISGSMLVNASINDSGIVTKVNITVYNNTGNVTALIPMSLTSGTASSGYWTAVLDTPTLIPRDGAYNISVNATDSAANINISGNVTVFVDNTKPNATAIAPVNGSVYDSQGILINASLNDSITGIFNATFRLVNRHFSTSWLYASMSQGSIYQGYWNATFDSSSVADGLYNVTVNATDFAGSQLIANISGVVVDNDAPNTTIILPASMANVSGAFIINASINDTPAFAQFVNATIFNSTGNVTAFIPMSLGAGTSSAGYWNATFDSTLLPDGFYNISINATNSYLNTNISSNRSVTIDNTLPNATMVAFANSTNLSGIFVINASVNDSVSGAAAVSFKVFNSTGNTSLWLPATRGSGTTAQGYWNATFQSATVPDGIYNITINATDYSGNSLLANISSVSVDNSLPSVTLSSPPNNTANDTTVVAFTATSSDNSEALQGCSLLLNGTVNKTVTAVAFQGGSADLNFTVEGFNEGAYLWNVRCTDTAGNSNAGSLNLTLLIDHNAPFANITVANGTFFNLSAPNITVNFSDSIDFGINYTVFADSLKNQNGTLPLGSAANVTLLPLPDGQHSLVLEVLDDAGHRANSSEVNITIDTVVPFIQLNSPANNTNITLAYVQFNFSVSDGIDSLLDCGLYIDAVLNQSVQVASGNSTNISIANFTIGQHGWNVSCSDDARNLNWSQNYFFNVSRADLQVLADNISFSTESFEENTNFTLFANITNEGDGIAQNALVEFLNSSVDGNLLGTRTITLLGGHNATVNITVAFPIGTYAIVVRVDGVGSILESSEDNNIANSSFTVPLWDSVVGNISGELVISEAGGNSRIFVWEATNRTAGSVFATDIDSSVSWANLTALSRNVTGNYSADDFAQLDEVINSTGYSDSVNRTFTDGGLPKSNATLGIFSRQVSGVPLVNSTNTSSFMTGILWDASDTAYGEYNGSQDVVLITQINYSQQGKYGVYDYELAIPATLRRLKAPDFASVVFYMELK